MLYGIFNDEAGGGIVGNLAPPGSTSLRTGPNPWDGQGRKNLAAAAGRKETS